MKPALCIVGHGSRDPQGTRRFLRLVEMFQEHDPTRIVECGFLEFAQPVVQEGFDRCVSRGARSVAVLPGMLMAAGHAKNDIPSEIQEARLRHPQVAFHYGRHLHLHPKIIQLSVQRIEEAEANARPLRRQETLLLVVGRGSSDPDANADVHKLTRILWECLGVGWGATAFSGVTAPVTSEALARCQRMGFARIIVFPFFLFTGVLEKRIRRDTEAFAALHPETELVSAGCLDAHPSLFDAFLERSEEAIYGNPNMNCELCKYRVQLPGFEQAVGQPQFGHHHRVRGIGQDDVDPSFEQPHGHSHEYNRQ